MRTEELMIGDWVSLREMPELHMKVRSVLSNGYIEVQEYEGHPEFSTMGLEPERVLPIYLTPEILEKNGYTPHDELVGRVVEWISEDNRITMSDWEYDINSNNHWFIHIDNEDMDTICTAEITYVHEFQHLLRLCKIEKEIVL